MNTTQKIEIFAEVTPNPNTLKFNVNRRLLESGSVDFPDAGKAKHSPLASALFQITHVIGVLVGTDFITVTKAPSADWSALAPPVVEHIRRALNSDEKFASEDSHASSGSKSSSNPQDLEIEKKIREILDNEIRPAVAMDGGDITFYGYENGVVTLHLQGSCSTCPSSIMTLKMGVENRLRSLIPQVKEVIQV